MKQRTGRQHFGHGVALVLACLCLSAPAARASVMITQDTPVGWTSVELTQIVFATPAPPVERSIDWGWRFATTTLTLEPGTTTEISAVLENRSTGVGATLEGSHGLRFNSLPDKVTFEFSGSLIVPGASTGPVALAESMVLIPPGEAKVFPVGLLTIAPDFTGQRFVLFGEDLFLNSPSFPPVALLSPFTTASPVAFAPLALAPVAPDFRQGENSLTVTVASAPEPATLALMGLGIAAIGYRRRLRKIAA